MKKILLILLIMAMALSVFGIDKAYYRESFHFGNEAWAPDGVVVDFFGDGDSLGQIYFVSNTDTVIAGTLSISGLQAYNEFWWRVTISDPSTGIDMQYIVPIISVSDQLDIEAPTDTNTCMVYVYITDMAGNPKKNGVLSVTATGENIVDTCTGGVPTIFTRKGISDATGIAQVAVTKSKCLTGDAQYSVTVSRSRNSKPIYSDVITIPDQDSLEITVDR